MRDARSDSGIVDATMTYKDQYRIKHHALVELYKLCRTLGNFKNGVEHQGSDEGEVYASGVFDRVEAALRQPYIDPIQPNYGTCPTMHGERGKMTETRDFPVAVIASISTGVLLCKFGDMHEAAEYLMGHPIFTHHFADRHLCDEMRRTILAQCPGFPTEAAGVTGENWQEFKSKLETDLGETVKIRKGCGLTAMLPTDGIPDHLKGHTITIEAPRSPQETAE